MEESELIDRLRAALMALLAESLPKSQPSIDGLLTVPEVARQLNYRPSYVYEMLRRGDLPAVRDRKFVRVRQSAVSAYISEHEKRGPLPVKLCSTMLPIRREWQNNEAVATTIGAHSKRAVQRNRRSSCNHHSLGDGSGTDT